MRQILLPSLALTLVPFFAVSAQESICNPCVDPPIVDSPANRIRRNDWIDTYRSTSATVIVTAEDMRNLGVTSVAHMVNQLPSSANRSPYGRPVSLGSADAYPAEFAAVFAAAASHLQLLEYEPVEFNARLIVCNEGRCVLHVYPAELGDAGAVTVRECPDGYCATIVYLLQENRIVEIRD
jgi:hypothetical protein